MKVTLMTNVGKTDVLTNASYEECVEYLGDFPEWERGLYSIEEDESEE